MDKGKLLFSGYTGNGEEILLMEWTPEGLVKKTGVRHGGNPSFCCRWQDRLYAVSELAEGAAVVSYDLRGDTLSPLGKISLPGRKALCHLTAVDGVIFGSCYGSGHYFAVDADLTRVLWEFLPSGTPRAHWVQPLGDGICLADLGNSRLYRFPLSGGVPQGEAQIISLPEGSGPRQPIPLSDGGFAVVCELDGMLRFFDKEGGCVQTIPASGTGKENAPGGGCVAGDVLFVGNRGPNTVSAFRLTKDGAVLAGEWESGNWPRHLAFVGEDLLFAACQRENSVWQYRWDGTVLTKQAEYPLHQASCVLAL